MKSYLPGKKIFLSLMTEWLFFFNQPADVVFWVSDTALTNYKFNIYCNQEILV